MDGKYKHDIFISFTHKDETKVGPIYRRIKQFDLKPFWSKDLPRGRGFKRELEKALRDSRHFLLFCSDKAMQAIFTPIFSNFHLTD